MARPSGPGLSRRLTSGARENDNSTDVSRAMVLQHVERLRELAPGATEGCNHGFANRWAVKRRAAGPPCFAVGACVYGRARGRRHRGGSVSGQGAPYRTIVLVSPKALLLCPLQLSAVQALCLSLEREIEPAREVANS